MTIASRLSLLLSLQCVLAAVNFATAEGNPRRNKMKERANSYGGTAKSSSSSSSTLRSSSSSSSSSSIVTFPLLHRHHVVHRRRLESSSSSQSSSTTSYPWGDIYQGWGTHYVDLWIGSPPQRQTVIIDTGSDITAFPCEECTNRCGQGYHVNDPFAHSQSTSFKQVECDYGTDTDTCPIGGTCEMMDLAAMKKHDFRGNNEDGADLCRVGVRYAEGSSWDAFGAQDTVFLGGVHDKEEEPPLVRRERRLGTHGKADRNTSNSKTSTINVQYLRRGLFSKGNETAHNTADLESEFLKEAQAEEKEYKSKHPSSTDTGTKDKHVITNSTSTTGEIAETEETPSPEDFSFELSFGCQYRITGLFRTQLADGIMGMEQSEDSFWMQMYNANMIQSKMFALCFTRSRGDPKKTGSLAGAMTMGGADVRMHKNKMVYAQNVDTEGWYTVYITGIYLQLKGGVRIGGLPTTDDGNDDDADDGIDDDASEDSSASNSTFIDNDTIKLDLNIEKLNKEGVIIDSGTTDTYLPSFINSHFEDAFQELYGYTLHDTLHSFSPEEIVFDDLPTVIIQMRRAETVFDNDDDAYEGDDDDYEPKLLAGSLDETSPDDVIVEIPAKHYLTYNPNRKKIQPRLHIDDEDGFGLLGANTMFNYDILFDMENSRVGFAKSDCKHAELED